MSTSLLDRTWWRRAPAPPSSLLSAAAIALALLTAVDASPAQTARGQLRGARLPDPGVAWLELAPAFESWNAEYPVGGGSEEPLSADFDGPVSGRLYPGAAPFLSGLRQDAAALGYDSLPDGEFSLGALGFDRLHANRRLVPVTAEVGLLERLSARLTLPLVKSQTEAFFDVETGGVGFAPLSAVVATPADFASGFSSARQSLREQVEGGSLSAQQEQRAEALLARSGSFLAAFSRRADADLLFPLAQTRPGTDLLAAVDSMVAAFDEFGVQAPGLPLDSAVSRSDVQSFFTGALAADSLSGAERGWALEGVELGARLGLLDTFSPPGRPEGSGLELRTTVGAAVRLPLGSAGQAPFVTPASFLDVPISAGQTDVELTLFQDVGLGPLLLRARGRYGRQLADELRLRVHSPERPFPVPSAAATVRRELGDYWELRLAPRLELNRALSMGAEYTYWRKGADRYSLVSGSGPSAPDGAAPLAEETRQRRHRLGVGIHYRALGDSADDDSRPVEISFLFQTPVAGSGGQTPASQLTTVRLRVPIALPWRSGP